MPVTVDLGVTELAGTRFAISPLSETISALQQLGNRGRRDSNLRWIRWARDILAADPLHLPRTWPLIVSDQPSWPEFLLPAPIDAEATIEDDLAAIRRTTARQVRASLRRVFGDNLPGTAAELASHPAAGLAAITAELRQAHDRLIAPHWARIRAVLDADIAYRARQLAAGGADRLFADLHPDLHWSHGRLILESDRRNLTVTPQRGGLVLLPVVLGPANVLVKGATSTQITLRYPARGIATLWTAGTRPVRGNTIQLLGRHRAELLEALRSPATTTDLAHALSVTPSAISQHLRVLRQSGLITGERIGRTVLYLTTQRGLDLLDPETSEPGIAATARH